MGLVTRRSEQLDKLFDQFAVDPKKPKATKKNDDKKEKDNKDKEYVVSKKDAELSELLTGTINDYPDDPVVPLQDVDQKTIERIILNTSNKYY